MNASKKQNRRQLSQYEYEKCHTLQVIVWARKRLCYWHKKTQNKLNTPLPLAYVIQNKKLKIHVTPNPCLITIVWIDKSACRLWLSWGRRMWRQLPLDPESQGPGSSRFMVYVHWTTAQLGGFDYFFLLICFSRMVLQDEMIM